MIWFNNWASLSSIDRVCYMMLYIVTHRGEGRWKSPSGQKENLNCSVLVSNLKTYLNYRHFWIDRKMKQGMHLVEMNLLGVQCWHMFGSWKIAKMGLIHYIWKCSRKLSRGCG